MKVSFCSFLVEALKPWFIMDLSPYWVGKQIDFFRDLGTRTNTAAGWGTIRNALHSFPHVTRNERTGGWSMWDWLHEYCFTFTSLEANCSAHQPHGAISKTWMKLAWHTTWVQKSKPQHVIALIDTKGWYVLCTIHWNCRHSSSSVKSFRALSFASLRNGILSYVADMLNQHRKRE